MSKPRKQRRRPQEPDEPMMIVCGWFAPDKPYDLIGVHTKLVRLVEPFRCYGTRANVIWTDGRMLDEAVMGDRRDHGLATSARTWPDELKRLAEIGTIEHVNLSSDAYFVIGSLLSTENGDAAVPPHSYLIVNDVARRLGVKKYDVAAVAREAIRALDADGQCVHAVVDYDYCEAIDYGCLYTLYPSHPQGWSTWVHWYDWSRKGSRQLDRLRTVAWGTYVGPRLAERLGKSFVDEYLALDDGFWGAPQTAERLPGGGIYVTLTSTPRDMVECQKDRITPKWIAIHKMPIVQNAVWLRQRFRAAGML